MRQLMKLEYSYIIFTNRIEKYLFPIIINELIAWIPQFSIFFSISFFLSVSLLSILFFLRYDNCMIHKAHDAHGRHVLTIIFYSQRNVRYNTCDRVPSMTNESLYGTFFAASCSWNSKYFVEDNAILFHLM